MHVQAGSAAGGMQCFAGWHACMHCACVCLPPRAGWGVMKRIFCGHMLLSSHPSHRVRTPHRTRARRAPHARPCCRLLLGPRAHARAHLLPRLASPRLAHALARAPRSTSPLAATLPAPFTTPLLTLHHACSRRAPRSYGVIAGVCSYIVVYLGNFLFDLVDVARRKTSMQHVLYDNCPEAFQVTAGGGGGGGRWPLRGQMDAVAGADAVYTGLDARRCAGRVLALAAGCTAARLHGCRHAGARVLPTTDTHHACTPALHTHPSRRTR